MALAKQVKVLSDGQLKTLLAYCQTTRHPIRNTVVVLLSFKAGLRAGEIANLRWKHCLEGGGIAQSLTITNNIAKGISGGRSVPMHRALRAALADLFTMSEQREWLDPVITTERCRKGIRPQTITNWFHATYKNIGFAGCSSHSGRRTFITKAAKL
jgi:integrase/recombinase XerD